MSLTPSSKSRPFNCTHPGCSRAFDEERFLRKHTKTHYMEYECSECGKVSNRRDNCVSHIIAYHKNIERPKEAVISRNLQQQALQLQALQQQALQLQAPQLQAPQLQAPQSQQPLEPIQPSMSQAAQEYDRRVLNRLSPKF